MLVCLSPVTYSPISSVSEKIRTHPYPNLNMAGGGVSVSLIVRLISPLNPGTIQRKGFFWSPFCDIIILFSSATPSLDKDYDIALF